MRPFNELDPNVFVVDPNRPSIDVVEQRILQQCGGKLPPPEDPVEEGVAMVEDMRFDPDGTPRFRAPGAG